MKAVINEPNSYNYRNVLRNVYLYKEPKLFNKMMG